MIAAKVRIFGYFCLGNDLNTSFLSFSVKPGVLRFVPNPTPEPTDPNRLLSVSSSPQTSISNSGALRVHPTSILAPGTNLNLSSANQLNQPVSMVKMQKKQREKNSEFDGVSRDRDDVQSPAYSDISDDSTPVAETDSSGN